MMKKELDYTSTQKEIAASVRKIATKYDRKYMLKQIEDGSPFPQELWDEVAKAGYLGTTIPERYGGSDLGYDDLRVFYNELSKHGIATLHFIGNFMDSIMVSHGSDEMKERFLPSIAKGDYWSFSITEPDAGTNAFKLRTLAVKEGDHYVINGQKIFATGVKESKYMILVTRTIPYEKVKDKNKADGFSLFVIDPNSPGITMQDQHTATYFAERQYTVFLDDVKVPKENLIGEENKGLKYLFYGLNLERILIAAFSLGMGEYVLERGVEYARTRTIYEDPIGSYQGVQHMLARAFVQLKLAGLADQRAARALDAGEDINLVGMYANMAKLAGTEAAYMAADAAFQVHGGGGVTRECDIINFMPMIRAMRVAPVNNETVLNYLGSHILGLPSNYK